MKIAEFVKNHKPIQIGGITFELYGVNMYDNADTHTRYPFNEGIAYSFAERYQRALEEISQDIKGMSIKEVQQYYKENTTDDNANYYGEMCFVYTKDFADDQILFGVRMD